VAYAETTKVDVVTPGDFAGYGVRGSVLLADVTLPEWLATERGLV
jgi:hypothetical protein